MLVYDSFEVRKMLISEVSKITNLTKKAIEYYTEQELVSPIMLENGYRDFSENDVERLKLIFILRRLGLNIEDLNEPITTTEQEAAYAEIISFLDNMPTLDFPEELQSIITESTKHISADSISDFMEKTKTETLILQI